jgi:peptide/nickel transport system permease protein
MSWPLERAKGLTDRFSQRNRSGLGRFVVRRIAVAVPALVGLTVVTFVLESYLPGSPLIRLLGQHQAENPKVVQAFEKAWGLNRPLPQRYLTFLWHLLHGNLGLSFTTGRTVSFDLGQYFPATIELALVAMVFTAIFGMGGGVLAALSYRRWPDYLLRGIALVSSGVPVFWLGIVALEVCYLRFHWFPGPEGRLSLIVTAPPHRTGLYTVDALINGEYATFWNALWHLILPAMVLGSYFLGLLLRITRASLLSVLQSNFLMTARAKGLPVARVILRHALPNALVSSLTVLGLAIGGLLSGAVLTETVFDWPGIGRYLVQAAENLDYSAVVGCTLLIGVVYVVTGALVDILYAAMNPRIRLESL